MKFFVFFLLLTTQSFANQPPQSIRCSTVKKSSHLILQKCDSLHILWLTGTPVERAQAHGSLMGKEFTLDNLNLFLELSVRGLHKNTLSFSIINKLIDYLVWWAGTDAPASYHQEIEAMASAAGIEPLNLKRAFLLPDFAAFSWAALSKQGKNLPAQGCTSAIYSDPSGRFIQGRNLDFPGSPSFDENPLLIVHRPEPGSKELKHVSIGTHGLQFSGITGFNEAGITFAVHQNYTRLLSIKGVPMPFVGELVLRQAHNLDEALEVIKNNRPGPLWTFVLSDLKTQEALTVEVSNTEFKVRKKSEALFAQANHLIALPQTIFALIDAGTFSNSQFRYDKAVKIMSSWKSPTAKNMAELLGFQQSREAFSPIQDVAKYLTIQSVIYEKNRNSSLNNFYVTIDSAPAPTKRWIKFDLNSFWKNNSFADSDIEVFDYLQLTTSQKEYGKKWSTIYAKEILHLHGDSLPLIKPLAQSPDSFLALSSIQIKELQFTDALISAQEGLKALTTSTPKLITQGLYWMEIASLWHLNKREMAVTKALGFLNQGIVDPSLEKQVRKILKKESPSEASLSPTFDFFGGYLQGMPSQPTD